MGGPLNRLPIGILGLFDIRGSGGTYPRTLLETIQPQVDIGMFMRGGTLLDVVGIAIGVNGPEPFDPLTGLQVPDTETWFLSEFSVSFDALAADQAIEFAPAWSPRSLAAGGFQPHLLGDFTTQAVAASSRPRATASYGMPRILPPGSLLGIATKSMTVGASGTTNGSGLARIVRLTA